MRMFSCKHAWMIGQRNVIEWRVADFSVLLFSLNYMNMYMYSIIKFENVIWSE